MGVHGDKLKALLSNNKLPQEDIPRVNEAIDRYDEWITKMDEIDGKDKDNAVSEMVSLLNEYKYYIDFNFIFQDKNDFLYRSKGQHKTDNTVLEEFIPILVRKVIPIEQRLNIDIGSQTPVFSSLYFSTSIHEPVKTGAKVKAKDQDFSISRKVYIKASFSEDMAKSASLNTNVGYVAAEIKSNLDKTMFQEAIATSHDLKQAVSGSKYYLLCEYLDMPPISTDGTDIDEIMILRKAKRLGSQKRDPFSSYKGRLENMDFYSGFLKSHPFQPDVFSRFITHIEEDIDTKSIDEDAVLELGYF